MGKLSIAEIKEKKSASIYTTEELFIMQNSCIITRNVLGVHISSITTSVFPLLP